MMWFEASDSEGAPTTSATDLLARVTKKLQEAFANLDFEGELAKSRLESLASSLGKCHTGRQAKGISNSK